MTKPYIDKVLKPYRANALNRELIRAALRLAEQVVEDGPIYEENDHLSDYMACTTCSAMALISYKDGRLQDIAVMEHKDNCPIAAYEKAKAEARL